MILNIEILLELTVKSLHDNMSNDETLHVYMFSDQSLHVYMFSDQSLHVNVSNDKSLHAYITNHCIIIYSMSSTPYLSCHRINSN